MRHLPWRELLYATVFIGVPVALYVGAYYAMVEPRQYYWELKSGAVVTEILPAYPFGGEATETFFTPMHNIDREFRPITWKFPRSTRPLFR
jgi:hypothetical protein